MSPKTEILISVSKIIDFLDQAKKINNIHDMAPVAIVIMPLEEALQDFFENKLKPIYESIQNGEDPFKDVPEEKVDTDWSTIISEFKSSNKS